MNLREFQAECKHVKGWIESHPFEPDDKMYYCGQCGKDVEFSKPPALNEH